MPAANTIHSILERLVICEPSTLPTGCWEWPMNRDRRGYGRVGWKNRIAFVHRLVYEHFVGPIPEGMDPDHLCRNPACANFEHIEVVPHKENCLRGTSGPAINAAKTHCDYGHPLSGSNLYLPPHGGRQCKKCRCEREKARRRRLGAKEREAHGTVRLVQSETP